MPSGYHYLRRDVTLHVVEEGDDRPLEVMKFSVKLAYKQGEPETGRFSSVENYDPGSGDELFLANADRKIGDTLRVVTQHEEDLLREWINLNTDNLCQKCAEDLSSERDV